ncbi:phosphate signaling complex protein PhoU [Paenibacillus thermoaerophilus]|uniref:Phosphate-specific transport system accessory protein PhoU n=1 Tax=Paenibacillus thermoaerophilus TaxID=1215385 RepID=A0ABW2V2W3_9BACL|nr:phosphate signaling complex protein PhoU [Paenibacillus thermoaerophilus]TMV15982.1 phosphate signaling complex protein PhoU [Paenibacillus thermoaerophilus]
MANRQQFETNLNDLKAVLIEMAGKVERAIQEAVQSLQEGDQRLAQKVIQSDPEINSLEEKIDEIGTNLIATQQPVAKDLRRIIVAFRIASDLERMADLAVDIAKVTIRIGDQPLMKPLVDIPRMAEIAQLMTAESIQSYINENVDLAYKMALMDDEVDKLHSQIMREMFVFMVENPKIVNQAILLCFVSRYLERMADHATNIGESVVYLVRGKRPDLNT